MIDSVEVRYSTISTTMRAPSTTSRIGADAAKPDCACTVVAVRCTSGMVTNSVARMAIIATVATPSTMKVAAT